MVIKIEIKLAILTSKEQQQTLQTKHQKSENQYCLTYIRTYICCYNRICLML